MIVELICFRSFLLNKPVYITTHLWHIRVKIILEHFCKRLSVAWLCYLHCWFVFWKIRGKKWNGSFCQKRFKEIMLVCDLQSSKCPWIIRSWDGQQFNQRPLKKIGLCILSGQHFYDTPGKYNNCSDQLWNLVQRLNAVFFSNCLVWVMLETISFCGRKIESIASSLANLHKVIVGIMCGFPLAYSMYRKQSVVFRSCCSNAFGPKPSCGYILWFASKSYICISEYVFEKVCGCKGMGV